MTRRIMIIDAMPTRRIVMKARLTSAQFQVVLAADLSEARAALETAPCDLVFVDAAAGLCTAAAHAFCTSFKTRDDTRDVPFILMSDALTPEQTLAALDAGFDEVMLRPIGERILLAQIRAMLRRKAASDTPREHRLLCEPPERFSSFDAPVKLAVVAADRTFAEEVACAIRNTADPGTVSVRAVNDTEVLRLSSSDAAIDAIVLLTEAGQEEAALNLLSDLRAHPMGIGTGLILACDNDLGDCAARAFDLGADSIIPNGTTAAEMLWRAKALGRRKQSRDMLRKKVSDGLRMAVTDPLTGLHNRRFAARTLEQLANSGDGFALLMLDLDHFKLVNDRYGHATGDAVLVAVADMLRSNLRDGDLLARIGGEEFLVALPGASPEQALQTAERLRGVIGDARLTVPKPDLPLRVTLSVGLIHNTDGAADVDDMLARADAALYQSKSDGRNRVSISAAA